MSTKDPLRLVVETYILPTAAEKWGPGWSRLGAAQQETEVKARIFEVFTDTTYAKGETFNSDLLRSYWTTAKELLEEGWSPS